MPSEPTTSDNTKTIAGLAVLGFSGYLAYEHWYKPKQAQQRAAEALARQIAARQALQPGLSAAGALRELGSAACQGVALSYGVPPALSGGVCGLAVKLAPYALKSVSRGLQAGARQSIRSIGQAGKTIVGIPEDLAKRAVVRPLKKAGREINNFFSKYF